jgi:5-methylcytosine-specific restriction protein A
MPTAAPVHRAQSRTLKPLVSTRPNAYRRGYNRRWQRARKHYLQRHPLCVTCQTVDETVAATVVDHIIPHRGDQELFWNQGNWQSLCKRCHDKKTAREKYGCN